MNIRIRYNHWIPRLFKVDAIVLYPFMLFADLESEVPESMKRHEWQHIHQINCVGIFRFYLSYILYYAAGRIAGLDGYTAYARIPWEEEARAAE